MVDTDDTSDGMGGVNESHGPGWSVVKRKKDGHAISAADSSGSSSIENVKRVKVVKNKSNDVSGWKVVIV